MKIQEGRPREVQSCMPLGSPEKSFVGSGVVGAGTVDGDCDWNFLIGPGYTSPNFLQRESLRLVRNGKTHPIHLDMHRIPGTGSLVGECYIEDIPVRIVDTTVRNTNLVHRWFTLGPRRTDGHISEVEADLAFLWT